jgi:hypothetical protein
VRGLASLAGVVMALRERLVPLPIGEAERAELMDTEAGTGFTSLKGRFTRHIAWRDRRAVESGWRAPRVLRPLLGMGRRSYEIYLTHMFVVIGIFAVFLGRGKPMGGVPLLFVTTIVLASLLSWLVAVTYSEPMNRWLRATADG